MDSVRISADIPRELHKLLIKAAQDERRSVAQEIIVLLERQLIGQDKLLKKMILEALREAKDEDVPEVVAPSTIPVLYMDADARIEEERRLEREKKGKR